MTYFQNRSTEDLIQICQTETMRSQLTNQQRKDLINTLETRRRQIEDELIRIGVPAKIIRQTEDKTSLRKHAALLGQIDIILST